MKITTETLAQVKARQVIWVDWMQEATAGLADTDLVTVARDSYAWGTFLVAIEPASKS